MTDTNRVALRIVEEATFGTTPATPAFEQMRVTSDGLTFTPRTVTSDEIRPDRQVTDLILVGAEAGGPIGMEVSHRALDRQIEGALFSDWVELPARENVTADSIITGVTAADDTFAVVAGAAFVVGHLVRATGFTNTGNNGLFAALAGSDDETLVVASSPGLTDEAAPPAGASLRTVGFQGTSGDLEAVTSGGNAITSTTLDFTTLGLVPGMWIKIGGAAAGVQFATAANNGWARIGSPITATRLPLDLVPSGWTADAGTSKTLQVFAGDYIRNGVTEKSYTLEREFGAHSPVTYQYFRGQEAGTLVFGFEAEDIMTATVTYVGKDAEMTDAGRFAGATTVAAPTGDVLNTSSNVGAINEGGAPVAGPNYVMSAGITIENNLRRRTALGHLGAVSIGAGEVGVTGNLNTYFGNKAIADKVIANTASAWNIVVGRNDGEKPAMVIDLPRLKFSDGSPQIPGKNQDVMVDAQFQAIRHPTLGYTIHIQRHHYLP